MAKEDILCEILGCGTCDLDILDEIDVPDGLIDELMEEGILSLENIVVYSFEQRAFDAEEDGIPGSVASFNDTKQTLIDFLEDNYSDIQTILDDNENIDDLLNKFSSKEMDIIDTLYENKVDDGEQTLDYYIKQIKDCHFSQDSEIYFNFLDTHLYIKDEMLTIYQLFFADWLEDFGNDFGMHFENI